MACVFEGNWYNLGFLAILQGGHDFANSNKIWTAAPAADEYLENGGWGVLVFWSLFSLLMWLGVPRAKGDEQGWAVECSASVWLQGSKVNMKCGRVSLKCGHSLWSCTYSQWWHSHWAVTYVSSIYISEAMRMKPGKFFKRNILFRASMISFLKYHYLLYHSKESDQLSSIVGKALITVLATVAIFSFLLIIIIFYIASFNQRLRWHFEQVRSWNHFENESSLSEAGWKDLSVFNCNILRILTRVDSALKGFMVEEEKYAHIFH